MSVLAAATAGIAKMIMQAMTNADHTYSGTRSSDMPGARCLSTVAMMFTAETSAEISVNVTTCAQTSTRLPGEYSGPESGVYANQPASGPMFTKKDANRNTPPIRKVQ